MIDDRDKQLIEAIPEAGFIDNPTAWALQRAGLEHDGDRCSAVQTDGVRLCDCGAVEDRWAAIRLGESP